ncbi:caspase b [Labeo rohita]|uniref:Caspase b n=1 Tax=Labeo rohita TaxID=84645 RepID=A0A498P2S1_LABRO|nr:caspase b [Labeo rohita]
MDGIKNAISDVLEQLLNAEFKKFVWHLWNGVGADIERIPRAALENADRQDVVDRMVQKYTTNAGTVAVQVLLNINQNDLAKQLEVKLQKASSQRKGSALLITNIRFDKSSQRSGAEIDEENMEWLLGALGYSVEKHTNLSGEEINTAVSNFSKRYEHQCSDSTFVVIMSHGQRIQNKDAILGVHYDPNEHPDDIFFVEDIFSHLNSVSCPALIDKPKIASRMQNDPRFSQSKKLLPCIERTTLVKKFYLFPGLMK